MTITPTSLLSSLKDLSQCDDKLTLKVRSTLLEPFQPDLSKKESLRAARPSRAEFKAMATRLAPVALRMINQNIETLGHLKQRLRNEKTNYTAAINCLTDTALFAIAAMRHMKAYTTLQPFDIEKTQSNLICKVVDLGEYARALNELSKLRQSLASLANVSLDDVTADETDNRQKAFQSNDLPFNSGTTRANRGVLTESPNQRFGNESPYPFHSPNMRLVMMELLSTAHRQTMSTWEEEMLQKYACLFSFPFDKSINDKTVVLLVLAYQMNAIRCWIDMGDGSLLRYLPELLERPGSFFDWCKQLKKLDPQTAQKQYSNLQNQLYKAASKLPPSDNAAQYSFMLQALALYASSYTQTNGIKSLCDRMVRMGISYEKSGGQIHYATLHKYCSNLLELVDPKPEEISGMESYFVLCEYCAYVSRKANSYKGAFYAFKYMMRPLRDVINDPNNCGFYYAAYAAFAKLSLGSLQLDKMVHVDTYVDINRTLDEICSCIRIVSLTTEKEVHQDNYIQQALYSMCKSVGTFHQSCKNFYAFVQKKAMKALESSLAERDGYSSPPRCNQPTEKHYGEWKNGFASMIAALQQCSEVLPISLQLIKKKSQGSRPKQTLTPNDVILSFVDIMVLLAQLQFDVGNEDSYHQSFEYLSSADQMCIDMGCPAGYRPLSNAFYTIGAAMAKASLYSNAIYPLRKACTLLEKHHNREPTDTWRLQLCKRYDILGTCCQKAKEFEDATKAFRLALKSIPKSTIQGFVKDADKASLSQLINRQPFIPKLMDRFMRSSIENGDQKSIIFSSQVMNLDGISPIQKCIIHECELKILNTLGVKYDLIKQRSSIVSILLYHYSAALYPIRRARVLLEKIGIDRAKGGTGDSEIKTALVSATEAYNLLKAETYGQDGSLLLYRRHYLALSSSWMGVCSKELGERRQNSFVVAIHQWGAILKKINTLPCRDPVNKEDLDAVFSQIDDLDRLYDHFRMLADFFAIHNQAMHQISILRLMMKINAIRIDSSDSTSASITLSCEIGRIYSDLGYSGKASIELSHAKSGIQTLPCSGDAELFYLTTYAVHLARIGNYDKSKKTFDSSKAVRDAFILPEHPHAVGRARERLSQMLVTASAYLSRSIISSHAESLDRAISDCTTALKILNTCNRIVKERVDTKGDNLSPHKASLIFKEAQWKIAQRMSACLLHLIQLHMTRGTWKDAQYYLQNGCDLGKNLRSANMIYSFLLLWSDFNLRLGLPDNSRTNLEKAVSIQPQGHLYIREDALLRAAVGNVDAHQQHYDDALVSFDSADELFQKLVDQSHIATLEKLVESNEEADKLLMAARQASLAEENTRDMLQYECQPLHSLRGRNTTNKALTLAKMGEPLEGLKLLEKLEESGAMGTEEAALQAAIALLRLSIVRQDIDAQSDRTFSLREVDLLPSFKVQHARTSVMKRANITHEVRVIRDHLTHSIERMLEAHRASASMTRIAVLHSLCRESGIMMFLRNQFANHGRTVVNNYAALSAYYLEMAKSLTSRREMQACLEFKLEHYQHQRRAESESDWPVKFADVEDDADDMDIDAQTWEEAHWINLKGLYSEEHDLDDNEFREKFVDIIPRHWTVCTLTVDVDNDELYVVRLRANETPIVVKLPLDRMRVRGTEYHTTTYSDAVEELKSIIQSSDETIRNSSQYVEKEQVAEWWTVRSNLNQRLKQLLENIQNEWFGGFKGLLCGNYHEHQDSLAVFQQTLNSIVYNAIYQQGDRSNQQSKKRVNISLEICRAAIRLGPDASSRDILDLIYFFIACYKSNDVPVNILDVEVATIVQQVRSALTQYYQTAQANGVDPAQRQPQDHVILIPDKHTQMFPLESMDIMRAQSVSRLPCLSFLRDRILYGRLMRADSGDGGDDEDQWPEIRINGKKTYYLLNPSGDLKHTQNEFEHVFKQMNGWRGVVQEKPTEMELISRLGHSSLYMYFGHSGGQSIIRGQHIRRLAHCPVAILMGCSSGTLTEHGEYDPHGYVTNFIMGGSPAIVANLWDVTDKSIDLLTKKMLEHWGLMGQTSPTTQTTPVSLVDAVAEARNHCSLPYLIGASTVVYGVPVYLKN